MFVSCMSSSEPFDLFYASNEAVPSLWCNLNQLEIVLNHRSRNFVATQLEGVDLLNGTVVPLMQNITAGFLTLKICV